MTTTTYLWDTESDNLLSEDDGTSATTYTNEPTHFGDLVSQKNSLTDNTNFYHFDARGDTRELTNEAESITDTKLYDAWGNVIGSAGTTRVPFQFVGKLGYVFDQTLATNYVRARNYGQATGRWLSADPLKFVDGVNLFAYGSSNPIGNRDPSGNQTLLGGGLLPTTKPGVSNPPIKLGGDDVGCTLCNLCGASRTKCDELNQYGWLPLNLIPDKPPANVSISTNPNAIFAGQPGANQYFGPDGLGPSVGVLVQIPDGKDGFSVLHSHLSGCTSAQDLLSFGFPPGSHGVICGGDNSPGSNCTYRDAVAFMQMTGIKIDGIVDSSGCFVGSDGRYYRRKANKPSNNMPPCF